MRLALIPAGGDWRDLQKLTVENGVLRDYGIAPGCRWHGGVLGVTPWTEPSTTITGRGGTTNGAHAVADPRAPGGWNHGAFGVRPWEEPAGVVTSTGGPSSGAHAVADPRIDGHPRSVQHGVMRWEEPSPVITSNPAPGGGRVAIADPRIVGVRHNNVMKIVRFDEPSVAVTAGQTPTSGGIGVADPRLGCAPRRGAYGVVPWEAPASTVTGSACHDNGRFTVADPREPAGTGEAVELPGEKDQGVYLIQALDGTWHRPMTTLERAALQGLVDVSTMMDFTRAVSGATKSAVSSWIGNAIPPPAMAESLRAAGIAILLSRAGETFVLSNAPVWVQPFGRAVVLSGGGS